MRKIVQQPEVLKKVREATIIEGVYKCLAFFSGLTLAENNALPFENKRDLVSHFDKMLWNEKEKSANARVSFGSDAVVRTCSVPLYELTDGKTRLSHACAISIVFAGDNQENVLARQKPEADTEFGGSLVPISSFLTVEVEDWYLSKYAPKVAKFWDVVEQNIAALLQSEAGLDASAKYTVVNTKLIAVERPKEHYQLLLVLDLAEDAKAKLLQNGWVKQTKADIDNLINGIVEQDDASPVAALALALGEEFFELSSRRISYLK